MKTTINKKITSAIISISLLFSLTTPVHASPVLSEDEFLLSIGVPQSVIEQMPEKQKELIYTTADKNARYESYKKEEFIEENQQNSNLQPRLTELPAAEMTISVISFKEERDTGTYYAIYPSFVWHGLSKIQNASYGMALYPNWEVIPQQNNLEVWNRNSNGDLLHHTSISATDAIAIFGIHIVLKIIRIHTLIILLYMFCFFISHLQLAILYNFTYKYFNYFYKLDCSKN